MDRNPAANEPDFTRVIVMGDVQFRFYESELRRLSGNRSFTIPLAQPNDALLFIGNTGGSLLDHFMASRYPSARKEKRK